MKAAMLLSAYSTACHRACERYRLSCIGLPQQPSEMTFLLHFISLEREGEKIPTTECKSGWGGGVELSSQQWCRCCLSEQWEGWWGGTAARFSTAVGDPDWLCW